MKSLEIAVAAGGNGSQLLIRTDDGPMIIVPTDQDFVREALISMCWTPPVTIDDETRAYNIKLGMELVDRGEG